MQGQWDYNHEHARWQRHMRDYFAMCAFARSRLREPWAEMFETFLFDYANRAYEERIAMTSIETDADRTMRMARRNVAVQAEFARLWQLQQSGEAP